MIVPSDHELIGDKDLLFAGELSEKRGERCQHCGEELTIFDTTWMWAFHDCFVNMHPKCLLDWIPRMLQDAERIAKSVAKSIPAPREPENAT